MARSELSQEALAHVVELPDYLRTARNSNSIKIAKVGETLKILGRDKALSYDKAEFEREFGDLKKFTISLKTYLKKFHLNGRIVEDQGKVVLFANESFKRGI